MLFRSLITGTDSSIPLLWDISLFSYGSSTYKSSLIQVSGGRNTTSGGPELISGLYRSTSAVTSITFFVASGSNFSVGTATLYGIKSA